jgi:hypothetical protein
MLIWLGGIRATEHAEICIGEPWDGICTSVTDRNGNRSVKQQRIQTENETDM